MTLLAPQGFRGTFRTDHAALAVYSEAAGIARVQPRAVAIPVDVGDLSLLVKWASGANVPLIPRGSGSSMSGGAVGDGVIVDVSRWRSIESVDLETRRIRVGPGALRNDVDDAARQSGLRFPVDPSSGRFCTVGGMVACNAAGAHTLAFGSVRRWVHAVECVFGDGSTGRLERGVPAPDGIPALERFLTTVAPSLSAVERTDPSVHAGVRKDSSGYGIAAWSDSGDLVDLIVGSEGSLAFITSVELSLIPVAGATASILAAFGSSQAAVPAAIASSHAGAVACELLDRTFLDVARDGGAHVPVPADAESVLLVEVEGSTAAEASARASALGAELARLGAEQVTLALDSDTEVEMWELRHAASPILSRLDPSLRSMQFVEDGAVPPGRLAEYVLGVRQALERQEMRGVIFGHAGDAHVHVNPLVDLSRADWRERVVALLDDVTSLAARLGGTLTGEHGDGRLRTPLLGRVWTPDVIARFASVKHAFDPAGILNPGVKVPAGTASSIGAVKYDPSLAALPDAARRVLARIERDRAYDRPRLELLAEEEVSLVTPA
ncbi:MAG: linked oxidase domain protein [Gemmatimonadetes bacterium]|nr:linked oxidase domain protein [Gemmatimonadota bacterium]